MQTSVNNILEENLGKCELFEEKQVGDERYNVFTGCPRCVGLCVWITAAVTPFVGSTASQCVIKPPARRVWLDGWAFADRVCMCVRVCSAKTATIVLRGGSEQFIEESHRSIHDALMIVKVRTPPIRKHRVLQSIGPFTGFRWVCWADVRTWWSWWLVSCACVLSACVACRSAASRAAASWRAAAPSRWRSAIQAVHERAHT